MIFRSRLANRLFSVFYLGYLLMMAGPVLADDPLDHTTVKQLRDQGKILPLSVILQNAQQQYGHGRILEAELEQEAGNLIYELEFLDRNGEMHELYYDAVSGELIAYETYETDKNGVLHSIIYDARTARPLDRRAYPDDDDDD